MFDFVTVATAPYRGGTSPPPPTSPTPARPPCRKSHSEAYDFVIVATGLYNKPARPAWAERLVRAEPPAAGPWVVDARDFTDASVAEVRGAQGPSHVQVAVPAWLHPYAACLGLLVVCGSGSYSGCSGSQLRCKAPRLAGPGLCNPHNEHPLG